MDGALKKVETIETAASVIAETLREMGGNGLGDHVASATLYLEEDGYSISLYARGGSIYIKDTESGARLEYERKADYD